jgi:transcriptional regulator with XRE-family HTH domain
MPPSATGLALQYLRTLRGLTRPALAKLLGWADASLIGRYERGDEELSEERLRHIAGVLGYPPEAVDVLLFAETVIARPLSPTPPSPVALGEEESRELTRTAMAAAWTFTDRLCDGLARASREVKVERAYEEADKLLARLLPLPPDERRAMVAIFPEFRSWALAVRLCAASVEAAAHKAEDALELADLACRVAERVDEDPGFRLRLEGYCQLHLGNARRVANDFDGSNDTFAHGKEHWQAGTDAEPPLLEEWRVLSLEASLRREQHRFAEALELIDRARAACREDEAAVARLLLKKANVLEQSCDHEAALAVLKEAAPFVEAAGEAPRGGREAAAQGPRAGRRPGQGAGFDARSLAARPDPIRSGRAAGGDRGPGAGPALLHRPDARLRRGPLRPGPCSPLAGRGAHGRGSGAGSRHGLDLQGQEDRAGSPGGPAPLL